MSRPRMVRPLQFGRYVIRWFCSHMREHPWRWWLGFNSAIVAVAFMVGVGTVDRFEPVGRHNIPADAQETAGVAATIAVRNAKAISVLMVGGVLSGGLLSTALLVWNSYRLGGVWLRIWHTDRPVAWLMIQYVPCEFAAMVMACSSCNVLATMLWRWLQNEPPRHEGYRGAYWAFCSLLLVIIGAALEALVGYQISTLL